MAARPQVGAPALLFERLADDDPGRSREPHPFRTHDWEGLRESVRREVQRLFDSRSPRPHLFDDPDQPPLTVLDYGVPDFSHTFTQGGDYHESLRRGLIRALQAFEPRLKDPEVAVLSADPRRQSISLMVSGRLMMGTVSRQFSFPTVLRLREGDEDETAAQDPRASAGPDGADGDADGDAGGDAR